MIRPIAFLASAAALALPPAVANAATTIVVSAQANSSSGGVGKVTGFVFVPGKPIKITSSTNDLWSAGTLPRFSDGSGLVADRFATAADDSGQPVGTLIGINFGLHSQMGHSAPFGALVGRYADGTFQTFGANFDGVATGTGALELYYWDSNNLDNSGEITFSLASVPEPTTWAMMILGFGVVGGAMRRRRAQTRVSVRYA